MAKKATSNKKAIVLFVICALFLAFAILCEFVSQIIDSQIKSQVQLATNKQLLAFWTKPPIKVRSAWWLYDIENAK